MAKGILIKNGSGISLPTLTNEATSDELLIGKELINSEGKILVGTGDLIELNFNVVGGTNQPTNPKENTIWVNTSTEITGWSFSAESPADPMNGMVWIQTWHTSSNAFNALKKNELLVYPQEVKIYSGSAWEQTDSQIYKNGAWNSFWNGELFYAGNEFESITGGWMLNDSETNKGSLTNSSGLLIAMCSGSSSEVGATTQKAIDVTDYSYLHFVVDYIYDDDRSLDLGVVRSNTGSTSYVAKIAWGNVKLGDNAVDIRSVSGEVYPYMYQSSATLRYEIRLSKIWLER